MSGKIEILDSRFHGNDRQKSEEQKRETASRFLFAMGFVRIEMDKSEQGIILKEGKDGGMIGVIDEVIGH